MCMWLEQWIVVYLAAATSSVRILKPIEYLEQMNCHDERIVLNKLLKNSIKYCTNAKPTSPNLGLHS